MGRNFGTVLVAAVVAADGLVAAGAKGGGVLVGIVVVCSTRGAFQGVLDFANRAGPKEGVQFFGSIQSDARGVIGGGNLIGNVLVLLFFIAAVLVRHSPTESALAKSNETHRDGEWVAR